MPSNLGDEFDTNPFLRPSDPNIRKKLGEQSQPIANPLSSPVHCIMQRLCLCSRGGCTGSTLLILAKASEYSC